MNFQLYFCNDGILRAKLNDNKPMIPLKFIQDSGDNHDNDFRFWTRWWESNVHFESGLTVGKFLSCLEPWGEFWSDFTGKNVVEYIKESRRPIVVKNKENNEEPLSWVGLSYYTEISPETEYGEKDNHQSMIDDINSWINSPKNTRLTGQWDMHSSYRLNGFVDGKDEQYSIDYTPMNELANLPFILSSRQVLYFCNWKLPQILGEGEEHFFKKDAFGVCSMKEGFTQFLVGEKYHNLRDVVEGFFWWFHSTPARRNDFVETILNSRLEIEEEIVALEEREESNVINLFGQDNEKEDDRDVVETIDQDGQPKKLKVKVASNAFSTILENISSDNKYWEAMIDLASKENGVVLRIGKIEEATEPEKRVFGHIIKGDDDPANPKPSEYKVC